jgi:hypothetical protein
MGCLFLILHSRRPGMEAYRTLVLKHDILRLPPEVQAK